MKATDVMTTQIVTIRGSASVADAVKLMRDKGVHCLIVERRTESDAYGILTETDIVYQVTAYGKDPQAVRVYEVMTKPCITVNPDLEVEYVARLFAMTGIRRAPVIQGQLLGMISTADILQKSNFVEEPKLKRLDQLIQTAIEEARAVSKVNGPSSKEAAAAWDVVEELQAEAAHQAASGLPHTAFEEYLAENPEALEARVYDV
ncbi:MAG: CP12 domain-containing protein [Prochlorothrix sp.]|nr:CP12 domain-containing protein [Prochlorothrix sp.]